MYLYKILILLTHGDPIFCRRATQTTMGKPWKLFCCLEDIRKEKFLTRSVTMTSSKEFNRGTLLIEETIGKVEWLKECASNEDSLIQFRVIQCLKTLQFY